MIRFDNVTHEFAGGTAAPRDLCLEIERGELMAMVGQSGSGKTTTLKLVNRLVAASRGRVSVEGRDVSDVDPVALRRRVGTVFQRFCLFPHWTVGQNVALVPGLLRWPAADIARRVRELLELVGLEPAEFRDRAPRELSGGEQQRVGIARALAARPPVLLMDEPFGALDPVTRDRLTRDFRRIHVEAGLTTLLVTHDIGEALLLGDRVAVLHQGRLLQVDDPRALVARPAHPQVAALLEAPRRQLRELAAVHGDA